MMADWSPDDKQLALVAGSNRLLKTQIGLKGLKRADVPQAEPPGTVKPGIWVQNIDGKGRIGSRPAPRPTGRRMVARSPFQPVPCKCSI